MDVHSETGTPMDLDEYFTYTAFGNAGEAIFSNPFGFISKAEDIGGSIRNSRLLNRYLAIAGYYIWFHRLFIANPVITWLGLLPMGHLFNVAQGRLEERRRDPGSHSDMLTLWMKQHHEHPTQLTYREVEAETTVSVGGGSDTLSCKFTWRSFLRSADIPRWASGLHILTDPTS